MLGRTIERGTGDKEFWGGEGLTFRIGELGKMSPYQRGLRHSTPENIDV